MGEYPETELKKNSSGKQISPSQRILAVLGTVNLCFAEWPGAGGMTFLHKLTQRYTREFFNFCCCDSGIQGNHRIARNIESGGQTEFVREVFFHAFNVIQDPVIFFYKPGTVVTGAPGELG